MPPSPWTDLERCSFGTVVAAVLLVLLSESVSTLVSKRCTVFVNVFKSCRISGSAAVGEVFVSSSLGLTVGDSLMLPTLGANGSCGASLHLEKVDSSVRAADSQKAERCVLNEMRSAGVPSGLLGFRESVRRCDTEVTTGSKPLPFRGSVATSELGGVFACLLLLDAPRSTSIATLLVM